MLPEKQKKKQILEYNLPFQFNNNRPHTSDGSKPPKTQPHHEKKEQEPSSRSNSIHGRKLSFCDAQLTVSQNTIETMDKVATTQRQREDNSHSQFSLLAPNSSLQQYSSFVLAPSQSESILNVKTGHAMVNLKNQVNGGRGKNPRQSKEAKKKKKGAAGGGIQNQSVASVGGYGGQVAQSNVNKLQKAIKQQFKMYQQSQKKTAGHSQRSPIDERRSLQQQQMNAYQPYDNQKVNKTVVNRNSNQPTSFMLTFNREKNSPSHKSKAIDVYNNADTNQAQKSQRQSLGKRSQNDSSRTPEHRNISSAKKYKSFNSSKSRQYSSTSPNKKKQRNSALHRKQHNQEFNCYYPSNEKRSYIGSGEKSRQTPKSKGKNIDVLVKNNIKKQKEREIKQQEIKQQQQEQLSQRKMQIDLKNKQIRKVNLEQNEAQKKKLKIKQGSQERISRPEAQRQVLKMKSKSPLKVWQELMKEKNKEKESKVEEKRDKKRIGLDFFEVKKELEGYELSQQSLEMKQFSQRNKENKENRDIKVVKKKDIIGKKAEKAGQENKADSKEELKDADKSKNVDWQKIIAKQYKKKNKQLKKQHFNEIIKQKKVIENLRNLNHQIEEQRKKMTKEEKAHKENEIKASFKVLREQNLNKLNQRDQNKPIEQRRSGSNENKKVSNVISARRQIVDKTNKRPPSSRVVYSYVSKKGKDHRSKSKGKNQKQQLMEQLLLQLLQNQRLQYSKSVQDHSHDSANLPRRSDHFSKKRDSVKGKHSHKDKSLFNDSPETKLKKKRKSHKEYQKQGKLESKHQSKNSKSQENSPTKRKQLQSNRQMYQQTIQERQSKTQLDVRNDDSLVIDEQIIFFQYMNTIAQMIQKTYRGHRARQYVRGLKAERDIQQSQLKESAALENRLMPSTIQRVVRGESEKEQKKTPKHTFSFGNYEDGVQMQQNQPTFVAFYQDNFGQKAQQQPIQMQSLDQQRQETSPIEDNQPFGRPSDFQKGVMMSYIGGDYTNSQEKKQETVKKVQKEEEEDDDLDKLEEEEMKKVLNINGKLQKMMQSLVQQQKQMGFYQQLKTQKGKNPKKQNESEKVMNEQEPNSQQPPEKEKAQISDLLHHQNSEFSINEQKEVEISQISFHVDESLNQIHHQFSEENKISLEDVDYIGTKEDDREDVNDLKLISQQLERNDKRYQEELAKMGTQSLEQASSRSLASVEEQTEKIICQSPINTNEEILDAAVNESNVFNNDESGVNESKQQSNIDDSQLNIQALQFERHKLSEQQEDSNLLGRELHVDLERHNQQVRGSHSDLSQKDYEGRKKFNSQQKPMLRLMFGDEQYLRLQEEQDVFSQEKDLFSNPDLLASGPHSNRLMQSENPFFLATNGSIFERNPFKEFTSNKLSEVLHGKSAKELLDMQEEALKYHEKLEEGFLNRMERKKAMSPKTLSKRKFELESWVTSERKQLEEREKEKMQRSQPLNIVDLEAERKEAARIIEMVNKKAKSLKRKIKGSKSDFEEQKELFEKQQFKDLEEVKEDDKIEIIKPGGKGTSKGFVKEVVIIPDTNQNEPASIKDQFNYQSLEDSKEQVKTEENQKETTSLDILEISFDEFEKKVSDSNDTPLINANALAINDREEEMRMQAEEISIAIFEKLIKDEIQSSKMVPKRVQPQQLHVQVLHQEGEAKSEEQKIVSNQQTIATNIYANSVGIETTDQAVLSYMDDIFEQIIQRRDLFMQAFSTPIYKNPLDILSNLQKPEFGDFDLNFDLSSSMLCILNVQLYLTLERARDNIIQEIIQQVKEQNLALEEEEITDLISEAQHIHNKVIFDAVNEALNLVRPYGIQGEPMPWSHKPRKNLIFLMDDPENLLKIIFEVKQKVMEWASTKAGSLPPNYTQQFLREPNAQQRIQMDEEIFNQQREKCLAQMLSRELVEGEQKWLDYEMEEVQVKMDLSDIVLEQLVGETCEILNSIQDTRKQSTR